MSIIWIWFIAKILIQILDLIGLIFDIPAFFIGMTLLSFGNSLPDLTLNCALAKAGYGEMGLAGSIAGPLFNLLVGLGASLIKKNLKTGVIEFQLFKSSHIVILISILILAINLIRLIIQASFLKFRLNKYVSIVGYIIYTFFFISICLFTFVFSKFI
jgi:Ca2+/Na+ antiporter